MMRTPGCARSRSSVAPTSLTSTATCEPPRTSGAGSSPCGRGDHHCNSSTRPPPRSSIARAKCAEASAPSRPACVSEPGSGRGRRNTTLAPKASAKKATASSRFGTVSPTWSSRGAPGAVGVGRIPPSQLDALETVRVGHVREEKRSLSLDRHHVLDLHAEPVTAPVDERLDSQHHALLQDRAGGLPQVRRLVQVDADPMAHERDRRHPQLVELRPEEVVHVTGLHTGPHRLEDQVPALHQVAVDPLRLRGWVTDDRCPANARLVAVDDGEDLDPADVRGLQHPLARPDVGQLTALAGGHDHQLEGLGTLLEDAACQPCGEVQLVGSLPLPGAGEEAVGGHQCRAGQVSPQRHVVGHGKVAELDADAPLGDAQVTEQLRQGVHRAAAELLPHANLGVRSGAAHGRLLHVDADERLASVDREDRGGVAPSHQRLRRNDEARRVGDVLRRQADEGVHASMSGLGLEPANHLTRHVVSVGDWYYDRYDRSHARARVKRVQYPENAMGDEHRTGPRTLVEHLAFAITADVTDTVLRNASLLVDGRRIADIGPAEDVRARLGAAPVDRVVDGRRFGAIPGLIDTHVHLSETLSRAVFPDVLSTRAWVFNWAKPFYAHVDSGDERVSVLLGAAEMLRSGTTCFLDMGAQNDAGLTARAAGEVGIRGIVGRHAADRKPAEIPPGWSAEMVDHHFYLDARTALRALEESVRRWNGYAGGRIRCWVNIEGKEPCSLELHLGARALAERLGVGTTSHTRRAAGDRAAAA